MIDPTLVLSAVFAVLGVAILIGTLYAIARSEANSLLEQQQRVYDAIHRRNERTAEELSEQAAKIWENDK